MGSAESAHRGRTQGLLLGIWLTIPELALAQTSPFLTGATSLQSNILAWLTPIAIILVMVAGGLAMAGRSSWGWFIGLVIGIPIAFGAPQIVTWVRGMFGT
ncbi:MAG: TrbC/VirB2 family protein [Steroidobacteraceae bacterium]